MSTCLGCGGGGEGKRKEMKKKHGVFHNFNKIKNTLIIDICIKYIIAIRVTKDTKIIYTENKQNSLMEIDERWVNRFFQLKGENMFHHRLGGKESFGLC